ncbi:RNA polymerase sigma-70 factor, ECF subfamily [Flavobacterium resistens]|uniref:RNA polymerase sigma-70 factor, ECF subfamily n=1 Tax=Flavobacterium resistens TaxID=443612 RepID=A0A521AUB1_9FLAO|nr:RNA polymerase sigma-70 factor, ECF subfamily [Flavobacterium resistens]
MEKELIPNLFRTEYQKIVSVLCSLFGIHHIEIAEDIVSDTFLAASETWAIKGIPENPTAWLYTVAKNKTKNHFKRNDIFEKKIVSEIKHNSPLNGEDIEIDLSEQNIVDSQLAMIFTVCNPCNSDEAQIALALNLLCGFGISEISDAFLSNKEVIYKRINRAKEKLKEENIKIQSPNPTEISDRIDTVLKTIYLLFSEGYYSTSQNTTLRKDLCAEAMRLNYLLIQNQATNLPATNALMALMCFHSSRFEARTSESGEIILYQDQDEKLWNQELIDRGTYFLGKSSIGDTLSKYHLEAGIAYWHTLKSDTSEKWKHILELYNHLIILEYSPIVALNRTFALSKVMGKQEAIIEAEKLNLTDNHFYYSLLGNLYIDIDNQKAKNHFETALKLAKTVSDKNIISKNILELSSKTKK